MGWKSLNFLRISLAMVATFLWGVLLAGAITIVLTPDKATPDKEWTLPALFEGDGALTFGCSFWSVPRITPYDQENPRTGFVVVQAGGDDANPISVLFLVDGPMGTVAVSGEHCAVSIDWRRFSTETRPTDR